MYLPKLREIKEALDSFFSKPYTTKFPAESFTARAEYRGKPRYHSDICVGCGTCAQVCPSKAISLTDDKEKKCRTLQVDYMSCMMCGQCEEKCITDKGIKLSNEYSLAVMDKKAPEVFETVDKELVICEVCGVPIGCRDHLKYVKERLGAKAYAHPNLLLFTQMEFAPLDPSKPKSRIRREDQIKEVCARCRQKVVVIDEF